MSFCWSSREVDGLSGTYVFVIKPLRMIISAWMLVGCEDLPTQAGDCVLKRTTRQQYS